MTPDYEFENEDKYDDQEEHDCYKERQAKPLAEQSIEDFDEFFRECEGLTFVFLTVGAAGPRNQVNTVFPGAVPAIRLLECVMRGVGYVRDIDEPGVDKVDVVMRQDIVAAIRERVDELNRRDVEHFLIWHVAGNDQIHTNCTSESTEWDPLIDFLVVELEEYLDANLLPHPMTSSI